ncbi:MAG TPA: S8 family serine peptidase, partial [Polyangiaceae bacterium]|nr:S8 family serine peptidase [Polyangiaceae bacterium]
DVDGDGVFTPGTDAIDLDQNGAADSSEVALTIIARTVSYYGTDVGARTSTAFDPSVDFLYLDTNGNGARDYGAANGFDDTTPAFGEPMFVPDDVDRNGKLDVGERVVRLGTSKFRKIYVNLGYPPYTASHVFVRGTDLSATKTDYSGGALEGFPDAFHATGVNTILMGDVPLVGRRWVGLAPDADVDVIWDVEQTQNGMPVKGFTWAMQEKPDVALLELAVWTGLPLDGTDALSTMIDTAVTKNQLTATCPTGDQGSARKHAHADVTASQQTSLAFDLPEKTKGGQGPLTYVDVSINVRGGTPETITIQGPNGESASFGAALPGTFTTGDTYYATSQLTKNGTLFYDMILYADPSQNEPPLPTGTWNVNIGGASSGTLSVDAYVADDKSSWAEGAAWDESIATNAATIGVPSTADHCIAVNAAPDHVATANEPWYALDFYSEYDVPANYTESQGQIRAYSPRGPRIDGVMKPDVTAPDNPWVANPTLPTAKYPYGSYSVFGGTSGASPHATGTAALLAQAGVRGDDARDAMRSGAVVDSDTGAVPNGDYGYGRLDAAGAFGVKTAGVDPSVTLAVSPANPNVGDSITLVATAKSNDGNDGALQAKWDDGYDGSWDTTYAAVAPHPITVTSPGKYPFKVRVRNSSGHIAEAIVWADVGDGSTSSGGCSCRAAPTNSELGFSGIMLGVAFALRRITSGSRRRS